MSLKSQTSTTETTCVECDDNRGHILDHLSGVMPANYSNKKRVKAFNLVINRGKEKVMSVVSKKKQQAVEYVHYPLTREVTPEIPHVHPQGIDWFSKPKTERLNNSRAKPIYPEVEKIFPGFKSPTYSNEPSLAHLTKQCAPVLSRLETTTQSNEHVRQEYKYLVIQSSDMPYIMTLLKQSEPSTFKDQPNTRSGTDIVEADASSVPIESVPIVEHEETCGVDEASSQNIFDRPYLYPYNYNWSTSDARFKLLAQFDYPSVLFEMPNIGTAGLLQFHALFKSAAAFTIRPNVNNYQSGKVVMFAVPGNIRQYDVFNNINYATIRNYPHAFLTVGRQSETTLEVNHGQIYNAVPVQDRELYSAFVLYVMVWSPLVATGNASSAVTFTTWIQPKNTYIGVKTTNLIAQSKKDFDYGSFIRPISHAILDNFDIPMADKVKKCGKIFGIYDRVLREDDEAESCRPGDTGIEAVNTKIRQFEVIPSMEHRFKNNDKTDLVHFAQTLSLGHVASWTTSTPAGSLITSFPLSPTSPMLLQSNSGTQDVYLASNCGGVANMFNYYRGSMIVQITPIQTSFETGVVLIYVDPYGKPSVDLKYLTNQYSVSMALGPNSESVTIRVPYAKHKDCVTVEYPPSIDDQIARVYVFAGTALSSPNGAGQVDLMFDVACGEDAEFFAPRPLGRTQFAIQIPGLTYQSEKGPIYDLIPSKKMSPGFMMTNHTDILNLMRRPEYVRTSAPVYSPPQDGFNIKGTRIPEKGYHAILSQLFKYSSGGVYVHFQTNLNRTMGANLGFEYVIDSDSLAYGALTTTGTTSYDNFVWAGAYHNMMRDPNVNMLIPGYNDTPFFYNCPFDAGSSFTGGVGFQAQLNIAYGDSYNPIITIGHSVADDFHFYCPMHMFKLALPIASEVKDGIFPLMTTTSQAGFLVSSTGITTQLNAFDRTSNSAVPLGGLDEAILTMQLPGGNTYTSRSMFMSLQFRDPKATIIKVYGITNLTVENELFTFTDMNAANGYNDMPKGQWFDSYRLKFIKVSPDWDISLREWQIYDSPPPPLFPIMSTDTTPTGFQVVSNSAQGLRWEVFDIDANTYIQGPVGLLCGLKAALTAFVPTRAFLRLGYVTAFVIEGTNDDTNWTLLYNGTSNGNVNIAQTFMFRNVDAYNHVRVRVTTAQPGQTPRIYSFQTYGSESVQPLSAQSDKGDKSFSAFSSITNYWKQFKQFINSIRLLGNLAGKIDTTIQKFYTFLKKMFQFIKIGINVSNSLAVACSLTGAGASLGILGVLMNMQELTSSVELKEELIPQGVNSKFEQYLDRFKHLGDEVVKQIRYIFHPSKILGYARTVFNTFGVACNDISSIYKREMYKNPDSDVVSVAFASIIKFFVVGVKYHATLDIEYAENVTNCALELEKIKNKMRPMDMYTFYEHKGTIIQLLPHIARKITDLRREAAHCRRYCETRLSYVTGLYDTIRKRADKFKLMESHAEPTGMFMCGSSGIGKTVLCMQVIPVILNWELRDDKHYKSRYVDFTNLAAATHYPSMVHTLITSEHKKFDSLYEPEMHNFIVADDMFTEKNSLDVAMAVQIINSAFCEVLKADVEDKGHVYKSDFFFCTSNESDPVRCANETTRSGEKIIRRFGRLYRAELVHGAEKFTYESLGRLEDMTMDERIAHACKVIDAKFKFTEFHYVAGNVVDSGRVCFRVILDRLKEKYVSNYGFLGDNLSYLAGLNANENYSDAAEFVQQSGDNHYSQDELIQFIDDGDVDLAIQQRNIFGKKDDSAYSLVIEDIRYWLLADSDFVVKFRDSNASDLVREYFEQPLTSGGQAKKVVLACWKGLQSGLNAIWKHISKFFKKHGETLEILGVSLFSGVMTGMVMVAMVTLIDWMCSPTQHKKQSGVYDGKMPPQKVDHLKPPVGLIPQGLDKCDDETIAKLRKNIVKAYWQGDESVMYDRLNAFFVDNKHVLINKHFFDDELIHKSMGRRIYITQPAIGCGTPKGCVVSIPIDQRTDLGGTSELYLCTLSVVWPNIRTVTHFIKRGTFSQRRAILLASNMEADIPCVWTGHERLGLMVESNHTIRAYDVDFISREEGFVTNVGDCGRPYYIPGVGIVGIHCAIFTDGSRATAAPLFDFCLPSVPENANKFEGVGVSHPQWHTPTELYTQSTLNGVELKQHVNRETTLELIEPPLVLDSECDYVPSRKIPFIKEGVKYDPLFVNMQKWDTDKIVGVPLRYIHMCVEYYRTKFDYDEERKTARVLSDDEMINGYGNMSTICMVTSPGIWAKWFKNGKRQMFSPLPQTQTDGVLEKVRYQWSDKAKQLVMGPHNETFCDMMDRKEQSLRKGLIPEFPFICTIKDELKPKEKYDVGKTRIFEQSSCDFALLCRKYFGHFINFYRSRAGFQLYHTIGRDYTSIWHRCAYVLKGHSPVGHAFDYKNFDGSIPAECYTFFKMVIHAYYKGESKEEALARDGLIDAMQNAIHIAGPFAFESTQGNKSGNAFTDVFNSLSNTFLIYVAWFAFQITHLGVKPDLIEFDDAVRMLVYGDDIIMSVRQRTIEAGFTGKFIARVMRELGVTITSAQKNKEIEDCVTFEELTFLKAPFVYDQEFMVWKAPLPIQDIIKELKYRPKTADNNPIDLRQRLQTVQRFLAHHDRSIFEEWVTKLKDRVRDREDRVALSSSYDALNMELRVKQRASLPLY